MALWALGLGLIVAYIAIHKFLVWRRLRHIPGASWCGWFDSWMLQRAFRGTMYDDLGQLCEQYGKAQHDISRSRFVSFVLRYRTTCPHRTELCDLRRPD